MFSRAEDPAGKTFELPYFLHQGSKGVTCLYLILTGPDPEQLIST